MKRVVYLATAAIVAMLILMPMVMAQGTTQKAPQVTTKTKIESTQQGPLPSSGGPAIASPSVLLPAAALLVGSGILTYAVVRRRR
jgi:hypothetical protein